jgi:SAM-dependent methyltransferase
LADAPPFVVEFGQVGHPPEADGRLDSPSFHRNAAPLAAALVPFLQGISGDVLEMGSGTGQHAVALATTHPELVWWPTDPNDRHVASIEAWRRHSGLTNLRAPRRLDAAKPEWRAADWPDGFAAMLCVNVLHISPWTVSEGLFGGATRYLRPDGRLFVYGPFMRDGLHTAPSNAAFDASLRGENPAWGVRDIADLAALAGRHQLKLETVLDMPANNFVLVFANTNKRSMRCDG